MEFTAEFRLIFCFKTIERSNFYAIFCSNKWSSFPLLGESCLFLPYKIPERHVFDMWAIKKKIWPYKGQVNSIRNCMQVSK